MTSIYVVPFLYGTLMITAPSGQSIVVVPLGSVIGNIVCHIGISNVAANELKTEPNTAVAIATTAADATTVIIC